MKGSPQKNVIVNHGKDVPGCTFRFFLTCRHPSTSFGGLRGSKTSRLPQTTRTRGCGSGSFRRWAEVKLLLFSLSRSSRRRIPSSSTSGAGHPPRLIRPGQSPTTHLATLPFMGDGIPPGAGIHPERPPAAMTSATHRRSRTRSQIAILDIDLANALSVAPAPRSWKAAEERVLSEFGGSSQTPMSAEANSPSPHKGYFVDDLKCVSGV